MPSTLSREDYNTAALKYHEPIVIGDGWRDYVVRREIKRLEQLIEIDICGVYVDFQDFLFDFYPDFSWKAGETEKDLSACLANERWKELAAQLKALRGYDFVAEMNRALDEFINEGE